MLVAILIGLAIYGWPVWLCLLLWILLEGL